MKKLHYIVGSLILTAFGYLGYQHYSKSVLYKSEVGPAQTASTSVPEVIQLISPLSTTTRYYDFAYQVPVDNQVAASIIKTAADAWLKETNIQSVTNDKQAENDFGIFKDSKYQYDSKYEEKENGDYITYLETIFSFTGGAHPSTVVSSYTFSKKDRNKEIKIADIYADGAYKILSDYSRKTMPSLLAKKGIKVSDMQDMFDAGTTPDKANWQTFYFKDNYIYFVFNQYQIGPYSIGIHEIAVPLPKLVQYKK